MKVGSFIAFGLLAFSMLAHADVDSLFRCDQNEAEFIGKVYEYRQMPGQAGGCTFRVRFSFYNEHGFCPLDQGDATLAVYTATDEQCRGLGNGADVSGVLVQKHGLITIEN